MHLYRFFVTSILISACLTVSTICINYAGFLFIDTNILRYDNHQLLDSLEEGIFILDEETRFLLFHNKAAQSLKLTKQRLDFQQLYKNMPSRDNNTTAKATDAIEISDLDSKLFAKVNCRVRYIKKLDSEGYYKELESIEEYKSLREII